MDAAEVPLSSVDVTERDIEAVVAVLRTPRLSLGPHLAAFESAVAARCGRKYGIGVNSGTSGLHLCVRACGIGEGDEVITTPFSFIATTNVILMERARPVFVDIDPASYNLDPAAVAKAVTPRTKALLPVEVFGNGAHFDQYERIAREHNLEFIEDCCEALGGVLGDRVAGSFGRCGVFAFYPNKQITTGEGGVIVTDDEQVREMCFSMRNQGRDSSDWFSYSRIGYNYRLHEISAALGEAQMARLDDILNRRRQVAAWYDKELSDLPELHLPPMADRPRASWFVYVVRLADRFGLAQREAVIDYLMKNGIGCNRYFVPLHTQRHIMEAVGCKAGDFPVTERIAERTIALPFFTRMTRPQVSRVKSVLKDAIAHVR